MARKPLITLYTPGNRLDLIQKAPRFSPDGLVLDLEDAVPLQSKRKARQDLVQLLPELPLLSLIRVNNTPDFLEDDLRAVVTKHTYGVLLPMAETAAQVRETDAIMAAAEKEKGLPPDSVKLLLLIETALGVRNCFDAIGAARRVESVVFGSGEDGDLQGDLRCKFSSDGPELMYARSKVLLDARAAGLTYVLDGGFTNIKNEEALRLDCTISRRIGYDGRTLIYPGHIGPAREIYSPSPAEVEHYQRMVSTFEAAVAQGSASIVFEGKLVDYAMLKKAKSFLSTVG
jgi:citrate lyase subunit beta/citryl-CoA lyase